MNKIIPGSFLVVVLSLVIAMPAKSFSSVNVTTDTTVVAKSDSIYTKPDIQAQFPGGMEALIQFLMGNVHYPPAARKAGAQGSVFVSFVVHKDGSIDSTRIIKSISPELDEESLRVVKLFPTWIPAQHNGQIVNARFVLPIMFKISQPEKVRRRDWH